jgi:hypothetical protein
VSILIFGQGGFFTTEDTESTEIEPIGASHGFFRDCPKLADQRCASLPAAHLILLAAKLRQSIARRREPLGFDSIKK